MNILDFIDKTNKNTLNEVLAFRRAMSRSVPNAYNRSFFEYRFHNPFFGYVEIQNDACNPFYMFTNNDDVISQQYLWYGKNGYSPASVREWIDKCKKSRVVLDVGAHTGLFTLLAHFSNPNLDKIISFEPLARAYSRILENLIANGALPKVHLERIAITNKTKKCLIYVPGDDYQITVAASYLIDDDQDLIERQEWCDGTSLDEFTASHGWRPDLIKLKMNGAELDGISGARRIIEQKNTTFFIELHMSNINKIKNVFSSYHIRIADDSDNSVRSLETAIAQEVVTVIAEPKDRSR